MTLETWLTFGVVWTLTAATPGPNVAFTVATGLNTPRPRAFLAAVGIGVGGLVFAAAVSAGLGTLLLASAEAFAAIKWIGVAYLLWLAWRSWRRAGQAAVQAPPAPPRPGGTVFLQALIVMLANPKAVLAYGAIFPAFVDPGAPALPQFAVLSLTASAASTGVHCAYVLLGGRVGSWHRLQRQPGRVQRASALFYLLAAGALALVRRNGSAAG